MEFLKQMLLHNIAWAKETAQGDPTLFERLQHGQSPKVLWIGCADSRVPAEVVTRSNPGDLFVHRNIANILSPYDHNEMSVVQYAVHVLKVSDIVVCGHYGCGGVRASMDPFNQDLLHVEQRLVVLRALAARNRQELDAIDDTHRRADRLAELNVLEQVRTLRNLPVVCHAAHRPYIHGWIFDIRSGRIKPLADEPAQCIESTSIAAKEAVC